MRYFLSKRVGQSILEYALLFAVVSGALLAMNTYVQRAMNARLKIVQEELYESTRLSSQNR